MPRRFLTYHAGEHDPKHTHSADLKLEDGIEVEVPPGREWLWWKLQMNPHFTSRTEDDTEQRNEDDADSLNYGDDVLGEPPPGVPHKRRRTKHRH